jgi:tRNA-binding protein
MINIKDFNKLDIRAGTIVNAENLENAKTPAYYLQIDFGKLGTKQSSAQITENYELEELIGRQIIAIVNFPPKRIAGIKSEVLVLGAKDNQNNVVLLDLQKPLPNGARIS